MLRVTKYIIIITIIRTIYEYIKNGSQNYIIIYIHIVNSEKIDTPMFPCFYASIFRYFYVSMLLCFYVSKLIKSDHRAALKEESLLPLLSTKYSFLKEGKRQAVLMDPSTEMLNLHKHFLHCFRD